MNKKINHTFRLWISKFNLITLTGDQFFLNSRQIELVMIQGIIINLRRSDSNTQITIDDSTGVVTCSFYHLDYESTIIRAGDLIRICGKPTMFNQELRIKLVQPPLVLTNFDEDIEWASSVRKLWNSVYTVTKEEGRGKELEITNRIAPRKVEFYEAVKLIRDLQENQIDFQSIQNLCGDNTEELVLKLINDGFLIQISGDDLQESKFELTKFIFHPKEVIKALFLTYPGEISLKEILDFNNGRFSQIESTVISSIEELLEENFIYEVSENLYSLINTS